MTEFWIPFSIKSPKIYIVLLLLYVNILLLKLKDQRNHRDVIITWEQILRWSPIHFSKGFNLNWRWLWNFLHLIIKFSCSVKKVTPKYGSTSFWTLWNRNEMGIINQHQTRQQWQQQQRWQQHQQWWQQQHKKNNNNKREQRKQQQQARENINIQSLQEQSHFSTKWRTQIGKHISCICAGDFGKVVTSVYFQHL